jgi:Zn-dependent peptidase ImmA (M78 family)
MTPTLQFSNANTVAVRLKEARLACGLSTRAVEELLKKRFPHTPVSHATIANYEKADSPSAPINVIDMLATIYQRPINWFLDRSTPLCDVRYRLTSSRVLVKERTQYEARAQHWLEAYVKLEERLDQRLRRKKLIEESFRSMDAVTLAAAIRKKYKLKSDDPIFSVIAILEDFGIRTIEMPTESRIDGFAARFGDEHCVVLNPSMANDRGRLNAAHELAHVLYGDCEKTSKTTREMDDRAFEFACHLLIPPAELQEAFEGRSAVKLVRKKEKFGISMAAMIYRAEKMGIIDARTSRKLWIEFSKKGWRAKEPGVVRADRAVRFEEMIEEAIASKKITDTEAAKLMNVTEHDLLERIKIAMGTNDEEGGLVIRIH